METRGLFLSIRNEKEKRQANYIAPLQPPTLAAFRPWGSSAGAGRVRPAGRKYREYLVKKKLEVRNMKVELNRCVEISKMPEH